MNRILFALISFTLGAFPVYAGSNTGGTNTGGTDRSMDFAINWCKGVPDILAVAERRADNQAIQGDQFSVLKALEAGITDALKDPEISKASFTLTYRMLVRGREFVEALKRTTSDASNSLEIRIQGLRSYYSFIKTTVSQLDLNYFIPAQCEGCNKVGDDQYEASLIAYAQDQLLWVLQFAEPVSTPDGIEIYPKGYPKTYLKIAELTTRNVGGDLKESPFSRRYSCIIRALHTLNSELSDHNAGLKSDFGSDRVAINETYPAIKDAAARLGAGCGN